MKTVRSINLEGATAAFAVANTPLFLLRKLRDDQAAGDTARLNSGESILKDLGASLKRKPLGFAKAVLPYVLLLALSYKRDLPLLQRAAKIRAKHYSWYAYLADFLLQEFPVLWRKRHKPKTRR